MLLPSGAALAAGPPDLLDVTLLAVIQGLTEFLPVSSSGHLVLLGSALGVEESGLLLPVALHFGTLLAVLAVYWGSILGTLRDLIGGRPRYLLLVLLGSVPAGVVGVLFEDWFAQRFADPRAAAWGLLGTSAILLACDAVRQRRRQRPAGALRPSDALAIGIAQAVAILPGVSRSGSTIGAGLALGLAPAEAARFSFLLSVVAVGGATLLEARDTLGAEDPSAPGVGLLLLGVALSAVVGWLALRLLLAFLARGILRWFAFYCATLGLCYLLIA